MPTEKMRMDPRCPNPGISDDVLPNAADLIHKDKFRSFISIPKERWEEIFGTKPEGPIYADTQGKAKRFRR